MRVDSLHRRIANDVRVMHDAVDEVLPVQMPVCYHGRKVNIGSFVKRLNDVTENYSVFNVVVEDNATKSGCLQNSAWWYPETMLPKHGSDADVHINWHVNPGCRRIEFTPTLWQRKRLYFWMFTMHEFIHRHQDKNRVMRDIGDSRKYRPVASDKAIRKNQAYLGDYDEVEAFAFQTAMEMRVWWPTLKLTEATRESMMRGGSITDPTYPWYIGTFIDAPRHPALLAYKRKLRAWHKEIGRNMDLYSGTLQLT